MKKIFGGINLTWPKVIIMAIIVGIYTAVMALLPVANDTSFSDLKVTFEDMKKCFVILTNMNFLLVCKYGDNGSNPEIIIYKKR